MPKNTSLGDLEQAVMDVLWSHEIGSGTGLTVREVLDRLADRSPAYTTVMTVLSRLEAKGVTTREQDGRAWRYRAASTREELAVAAMRSPLHDLSSEERQSAILYFLSEASADDLAAVREAMAVVETKGDRPRSRRAGPTRGSLSG